jgi:hypothetical protein
MGKDMYHELEIPAFLKRKKTGKAIIHHFADEQPAPLKLRMDAPSHKIEVIKSAPAPVNVQARVERRARQVVAEIDEVFEQEVWFNPNFKINPDAPYKFLHANNVSSVVASKVRDHYVAVLDEYNLIKSDPQVKEGYAHYSKKEIARFKEFCVTVVDACENFVNNQKKMKVRKPRKKRAVSPDKKLAKFKYCKMRGQLASVNPANVLGAQQVWLYDTRYTRLSILNAIDRGGIDIKGSTFKNVDEKSSMTKKVGRKTKETIDFILKCSKPQCRKILEKVTAKPGKLQLRSNANIILLRFFK